MISRKLDCGQTRNNFNQAEVSEDQLARTPEEAVAYALLLAACLQARNVDTNYDVSRAAKLADEAFYHYRARCTPPTDKELAQIGGEELAKGAVNGTR